MLCDRYRVDRVLGSGGMGVVVLAEHIELRERVAIKFLLDDAAGNVELSERFLREARAAVKIRSEHVVRVSDVGRLPSGAPYLVMEYLEGEDLAQRLERGPVPMSDAVDYVMQCCEAMHVAHRSGIVHRDLKPANLFLSQRPDGSPIIKVLDFGISKVSGGDGAQLSLTATQAMMGSPLYMSPEQMRSSKDVSAATDIWALGVILHELIAGDVPFTGTTVTEVLVRVMQDEPPRLRNLRPEVPEGLEAVVLRCLAKAPAERYSSVAALAVALTPYASAYTLGLQQRLQASLSEPPPAAAPARGLGATRVEANAAPPTQTATGWEGDRATVPRTPPAWRRHLPWAASAAGLALMGVLLLSRSRETVTNHAPAPAVGTASAPEPPPPALAPSSANPVIEAKPVTDPQPSPAVTPTRDIPGSDTPVSATATPGDPRPAAASRTQPTPRKQPAKSTRTARASAARPAPAAPVTPAPADPAPAPSRRPLSIEFK